MWLWYRVYPAGDYFSYACRKTATAAEIPGRIRDELFFMPDRSDAWIAERTAALKVLNCVTYDAAYFALLDKLSLPETKLKMLTYQTHEEKNFGRYCKLTEDVDAMPETVKVTSSLDGKIYLALNNYRHFSARGNTAGGNTDSNDGGGEIHGGNTPEEQ